MIFEHQGHNAELDQLYIAELEAAGLILPVTYAPEKSLPIHPIIQVALGRIVAWAVSVRPF